MRKMITGILKILSAMAFALCLLFSVGFAPSVGSVLFLICAALFFPLNRWQSFLRDKLKFGPILKTIVIFVLFLAGVNISVSTSNTAEMKDKDENIVDEKKSEANTSDSSSSSAKPEPVKETGKPSNTAEMKDKDENIVDEKKSEANTSNSSSSSAKPKPVKEIGKHLVEPGDVFDADGYISLDGVEILYNGKSFEIRNDRSDNVRITAKVVGVKTDGTYEVLQYVSFVGVDEYKYEKDKKENGWALKDYTNLVRPGGTLDATLSVFDFGEDYPSPDEDGNGYYDVVFVVHPQSSEDTVRVSIDDPASEVHKLEMK